MVKVAEYRNWCDTHGCWSRDLCDYKCNWTTVKVPDDGSEYRVIDANTGGMKNQKAEQLSLIPVEALKAVSRVYSFGAEKYDRNNWRLGYDWHLSYDALQRHILAFWGGENNDPESGESHLAHAAFHLFTLMTYVNDGLGKDDRA